MSKFWTKNVLFGYFGARISKKTIVIFAINTLKFVKNESLTHTMNFGIGSAFSKGPRSVFSEGPGPVRVRFIKYAVSECQNLLNNPQASVLELTRLIGLTSAIQAVLAARLNCRPNTTNVIFIGKTFYLEKIVLNKISKIKLKW